MKHGDPRPPDCGTNPALREQHPAARKGKRHPTWFYRRDGAVFVRDRGPLGPGRMEPTWRQIR